MVSRAANATCIFRYFLTFYMFLFVLSDPAERGRRVWEWWKTVSDILPTWKKALRLVVLVQPSSASAERVFSQLKLIVEQCGVSMYADMLLYRMLRRCNKVQKH